MRTTHLRTRRSPEPVMPTYHRPRRRTERRERQPPIDGAPSAQERLEASLLGRAAIGALVLFTAGSMLISNLPEESKVSTTLSPIVRPFLETTGLSQHWSLFAPTPRTATQWLEADLTYRDGVTVRWHQPRSDRFVGQYRAHRWQKWAFETIRTPSLWPPAAAWIARRHLRNGEWPIRVALVQKVHQTPGFQREGPVRWTETLLYVATFTPDGPVREDDAA